jgi:hypothetical protein
MLGLISVESSRLGSPIEGRRSMSNLIDLKGQRFGRLLVLERAADPRVKVRWHCQCDCGEVTSIIGRKLRRGQAVDCGCSTRETGDTRLARTRSSYGAMIQRCCNPNSNKYYRYGGRGIRVCDRWLASFDAFLDDVGLRPPGTSLDKIDNDGNYEPGNVRWADPIVQARNVSRGEAHGFSKLTTADVIEARRLRAAGMSNPAVAKRFNVAIPTIQDLVARRTWKHVA